ncbi:ROK family protein [Demequina sp. SYSU T00039]|uniref:ROK family protein n=1 Tax=Demequina lignilytica TaxID=3051663 RepID=A0AAW7M8I9_9MICO|nr:MULTISPECIES: ROK family protein [unclassified Demequina]MDN4477926.1 ROK family protein [Demequina sp. SYSU T00039-1]MDN4487835.1 ROK family protein [Demequina sp. SYSU T00039]MDN4490782.1 ROK family protein [Demequina sp. SYSU T00068]
MQIGQDEHRAALGVDIGGTKIAAGVVDAGGRIVRRAEVPTPRGADAIDRATADLCLSLAATHPVEAVGIAVAGLVSSDRETVMFAPNIHYRNHPIAARVRALLDDAMPVVVENDANAAGWAEFAHGGHGASDMLMLTIGTGVGGAIVADGRLLRGGCGAGAEVGHLQIVAEGEECGCGQRGCFEAYASGTALERHGVRAVEDRAPGAERLTELAHADGGLRGRHIAQAAAEGDAFALGLLDDLGEWIGRGAASLVAVVDPDVIVIGGGVASTGAPLFAGIERGLRRHLTGADHRPFPRIVPATFGNEAGILGAADLARAAVLTPA